MFDSGSGWSSEKKMAVAFLVGFMAMTLVGLIYYMMTGRGLME